MAEEAQELTVTNTGQPLACVIDPAETNESAQVVTPALAANVTATIEPAE